MDIKINSFEDACKFQKILDEEIGKVRNNGFVPKERTTNKIILSIIAECIEFNEELEETHKTWKQKEIKKEKQLEELTDIMFFIAQLLNEVEATRHYAIDQPYVTSDLNECLLEFIGIISDSTDVDDYAILMTYGTLINSVGYELEEIYKEYERKWKINMTRINKDWTL